MRWFVSLMILVAGSGCAKDRLLGGRGVAPGTEPPGRVVGIADPGPCFDPAGGPVEWRSRVFFIATERGELRAVEVRSRHDSLVFDTTFREGEEQVFQVVLRTKHAPARLHELRLLPERGSGTLVVAELDGKPRNRAAGFSARAARPVVRCALVPVE